MKRVILVMVLALVIVGVAVAVALIRAQTNHATDDAARDIEQWRTTLPAKVTLEVMCEGRAAQTAEYCSDWAAMVMDQHTETVMACWDENAENIGDFWECVTVAGFEP